MLPAWCCAVVLGRQPLSAPPDWPPLGDTRRAALYERLHTLHAAGTPIATTARGLQEDLAAVTAGLTLDWSHGPVEGQITRLQRLKRQGYGRAGFALLRQRVLQAA